MFLHVTAHHGHFYAQEGGENNPRPSQRREAWIVISRMMVLLIAGIDLPQFVKFLLHRSIHFGDFVIALELSNVSI